MQAIKTQNSSRKKLVNRFNVFLTSKNDHIQIKQGQSYISSNPKKCVKIQGEKSTLSLGLSNDITKKYNQAKNSKVPMKDRYQSHIKFLEAHIVEKDQIIKQNNNRIKQLQSQSNSALREKLKKATLINSILRKALADSGKKIELFKQKINNKQLLNYFNDLQETLKGEQIDDENIESDQNPQTSSIQGCNNTLFINRNKEISFQIKKSKSETKEYKNIQTQTQQCNKLKNTDINNSKQLEFSKKMVSKMETAIYHLKTKLNQSDLQYRQLDQTKTNLMNQYQQKYSQFSAIFQQNKDLIEQLKCIESENLQLKQQIKILKEEIEQLSDNYCSQVQKAQKMNKNIQKIIQSLLLINSNSEGSEDNTKDSSRSQSIIQAKTLNPQKPTRNSQQKFEQKSNLQEQQIYIFKKQNEIHFLQLKAMVGDISQRKDQKINHDN